MTTFGANRSPPMCEHSQTSSGHRDASADATGRPRSAQQTSCTPWVQTRINGWGGAIDGGDVAIMASAASSRSWSSRHRPVNVAESSPARIHRRGAQRSIRPGRRTSRIRVADPPFRSNADRTSESIPEPAMASIFQGPGCSRSSQRRAGGAEPAKGSARTRAASAHRNAEFGSLTPRWPSRRAVGAVPDRGQDHRPWPHRWRTMP
jgi:hypothetical protein